MIDRFIGIPYVTYGRTYEACDCWGLVWLYSKDVLGVELPNYLEESEAANSGRHSLGELVRHETETTSEWVRVDEPRHGDVVVIRCGMALSHVGIFVPENHVLHTSAPHDSLLEPTYSPTLARRIFGYYRHVSA